MDIASLSTAMSMSRIATQASTQVLKLSLDQLESTGEQMTKMMELSVTPGLGANLDVRI